MLELDKRAFPPSSSLLNCILYFLLDVETEREREREKEGGGLFTRPRPSFLLD